MKRILLTSALMLTAIPAWADDYASPGQLEAGGFFGIVSGSETRKPESGPETDSTLTGIQIDPQVGYFVSDGFELLGALHVLNFSQKVEDADPTTVTEIGLGAGAGYFLKVGGGARIGPQLILKYKSATTKVPDVPGIGEVELADNSMGAQVGAFAKLPIGGGGVIAAGLALDYDNLSRTIDLKDLNAKVEPAGTQTRIGARIGYFVFF